MSKQQLSLTDRSGIICCVTTTLSNFPTFFGHKAKRTRPDMGHHVTERALVDIITALSQKLTGLTTAMSRRRRRCSVYKRRRSDHVSSCKQTGG